MSLTVSVPEIVSESRDPLIAIDESWQRVPLGDIAQILNGFAFKSELFTKDRGVPLIRIRDVGSDRTECLYNGAYDERYIVRQGDLVVGMDGDFKCSRWRGPQALLNQRVCKIELSCEGYESRFLDLVLPGYLRAIKDRTSSVTVTHLSSRSLAEIPLPLPPLVEQRRIVEKVEALLAHVNAARDRLAKVPAILKRFRQSVLAAACSGELTDNWRRDHPSMQLAAALLAVIAAERGRRGGKSKPADDERIEIPDLELPETWTWCRLRDIAEIRLGGTPSRRVPGYWNGDIPWVSSGEVANCRISATAERITQQGLESSNAKLYPKGTVLIAMIGEGKTRGQAALLDIEACTNQNAAGLVFEVNGVDSEYVWYWALGEYEKNREVGRGGNQPALNGGKVRALPMPLPPLAEQEEIVRRLRRFLALADAIECRVAAAIVRADKLAQAILAKSLRGVLVPTEAELARREGRDYEPASALLERVTRMSTPVGRGAGKARGRRAAAQ